VFLEINQRLVLKLLLEAEVVELLLQEEILLLDLHLEQEQVEQEDVVLIYQLVIQVYQTVEELQVVVAVEHLLQEDYQDQQILEEVQEHQVHLTLMELQEHLTLAEAVVAVQAVVVVEPLEEAVLLS
jgi:hypothetical protein